MIKVFLNTKVIQGQGLVHAHYHGNGKFSTIFSYAIAISITKCTPKWSLSY